MTNTYDVRPASGNLYKLTTDFGPNHSMIEVRRAFLMFLNEDLKVFFTFCRNIGEHLFAPVLTKYCCTNIRTTGSSSLEETDRAELFCPNGPTPIVA